MDADRTHCGRLPDSEFVDLAVEVFAMLADPTRVRIVLALAEISHLAHWKASQRRRGCLSVPRLVELGQAIESKYLVPAARSPILSTPAGAYVHARAQAQATRQRGGSGAGGSPVTKGTPSPASSHASHGSHGGHQKQLP